MDEKQFEALEERLDKIARFLAHIAVKDLSTEQDKIDLLDRLGLRTGEIAKYLGKSTQNVSTVLGNIRKKDVGGKPAKGSEGGSSPDAGQSTMEQASQKPGEGPDQPPTG